MKTATLVLDEVLDLKAVTPLTEQLRALRGQPLAIDATAVRRVGGLCLQTLLAARAAWEADETPLTLDASTDFNDGVALLGAAPFTASPKEQVA